MRQVVKDVFFEFSKKFEGHVPHMYADVKNLITCGVGNLIDPIELAYPLPWVKKDTPATREEIAKEWAKVKEDPKSALMGHRYSQARTSLRLRESDIKAMVLKKLEENDDMLAQRFASFTAWPSDAILAVHSMAWALGPRFNFPKCIRFLNAGDFLSASEECKISEKGNPGVVPRNVANRVLLRNAHIVRARKLPDLALYYPNELLF